jgi:hypothetical protein
VLEATFAFPSERDGLVTETPSIARPALARSERRILAPHRAFGRAAHAELAVAYGLDGRAVEGARTTAFVEVKETDGVGVVGEACRLRPSTDFGRTACRLALNG